MTREEFQELYIREKFAIDIIISIFSEEGSGKLNKRWYHLTHFFYEKTDLHVYANDPKLFLDCCVHHLRYIEPNFTLKYLSASSVKKCLEQIMKEEKSQGRQNRGEKRIDSDKINEPDFEIQETMKNGPPHRDSDTIDDTGNEDNEDDDLELILE